MIRQELFIMRCRVTLPILIAGALALLSSAAHAAPLNLAEFPAAPGLASAQRDSQDEALARAASKRVSISLSSSRSRSDEMAYVAGFDALAWSGHLSAYGIHATTHEVNSTPSWSAHALLDALTLDVNARQILTHNGNTGVAFRWDELSPEQQKHLQGSGTAAEGLRRLDYLRGHRGDEVGQTGGTLRTRDSRLGAIVNANVWQTRRPDRLGFEHAGHEAFRKSHAGRTPTLYIGANDGMLHAFDATSGRELMAYVPRGVYGQLLAYTRPEHRHRYLVDGQVFSGDADMGDGSGTGLPSWRTLLVGGLGGGGRGYFVLDVTHPLAASNSLSSFRPSGVVLDRTFSSIGTAPDEESKDIGHLYAPPVTAVSNDARSEQIVKLNNRRWAVVMGNGVNSVNERPVLLIQYLDGQQELQRVVARSAKGQSNGLSAPRLLDVNGDGMTDIAYAGDLQGHLWKFDLSHADPMRWGVSAWADGADACLESDACTPFHTARNSAEPQPITTAPLWMPHPLGGVQILFGTGRNLTEDDPGNTSVQTIYALWDMSTYKPGTDSAGKHMLIATRQRPIPSGRAALVQQSVTSAVRSSASGTDAPTPYFHSSRNPVPYARSDPNTPRGWYLDLPEARERVLSNPVLFEGQKVIVATVAPAHVYDEQATGTGWINVLNMITGQPAQTPVFSTTDATMAMAGASRVRFGIGEFAGIHNRLGDLDLISFNPACVPAKGACTESTRINAGKDPGKRADWREIR